MKSRSIRVGYQGECIAFIAKHTSLLNNRRHCFASVLYREEYSPNTQGCL